MLGSAVDSESDGQPSPYANGDADDEDGIVFLDPLVPGETAQILVTSSAGGGKLNYFFDFDGTGGFGNNANEVFSATLAGRDGNSVGRRSRDGRRRADLRTIPHQQPRRLGSGRRGR